MRVVSFPSILLLLLKSLIGIKRPIGAEKIFQVCYDDYCERRMALSKNCWLAKSN